MDHTLQRLRALDFFMGLAFLLIGVYVACDGYLAIISPALTTVDRAANPGMTMVCVGGLLASLGVVITVIGLRGSGTPLQIARKVCAETLRQPTFHRGVIAMLGIAVYFFIFWGRMPYVLATYLFLAGMMTIFKAGSWWKIALIPAVTTGLIWYVFGVLAMVPLP